MVMRRDGSNRWARNNNWQFNKRRFVEPKFSSWGKGVNCQVVDVDPITVLANFKNG